jgi:hypothetical protein
LKMPFQLKVRIVPRRASDRPTQVKIELRSIEQFGVRSDTGRESDWTVVPCPLYEGVP